MPCYLRFMSIRLALGALALTMGATPALAVSGAPAPVARTITAQRLPPDAVSFAIVDPESGRLIAGRNVDVQRSPASTIKVVTTFASLDLLGPAYVWHTRGAIVIDDTAFSLPAEDPGTFDGKPNRSYNVVPDALMVNFQSVEFTVLPNPGMHRVDVVASPA